MSGCDCAGEMRGRTGGHVDMVPGKGDGVRLALNGRVSEKFREGAQVMICDGP